MAAGLAVLALVTSTANPVTVAALMLPVGLAAPLIMPPITALLLNSVPDDLAGTASGVFNTSRQLGGALAVAVFGALLAQPGRLHPRPAPQPHDRRRRRPRRRSRQPAHHHTQPPTSGGPRRRNRPERHPRPHVREEGVTTAWSTEQLASIGDGDEAPRRKSPIDAHRAAAHDPSRQLAGGRATLGELGSLS